MANSTRAHSSSDLPRALTAVRIFHARSQQFGWNLPYLMDEDQSVAKAFSASLTHEFFLYDAAHKLVFHGAAGADGIGLKAACEALLAGSEVTELWTDSQRALCSTY